MSFFFHPQRKTIKYFGLAVLLLLFGQPPRAEGQSGRRAGKPQPESSPVPQPVASPNPSNPEAKVSPPPGSLKHNVRLLIGRQSTHRRLQSEDVIFASFVNRLNSFPNVVGRSIGELKRQDAVIQAKGVADSFVVLLSFDIDSFQNGTIILNSPDLQIEYQILAPRTGKKLTKGKIYFQSIGGGRMRKSDWPGGTPIRITAEAAGTEAAEYVHDWLRLDETRNPKREQ
ncbi:MAG: hypothetical protein AABN95_07880 [Acidobacteriota bacterium]